MSQAHTTGKVLAGTVGAVGLLLATGQAANAASVTVKQNDTVWSLAQQHGVSIKSVEKLNAQALNGNSDLIYVGQKLQISGESSSSAKKGTYTVKAGDTLWDLADKYQTSVHALQQLNGLSGDLIVVGQDIQVPGATATKTTTKVAATSATTSTASESTSTATSAASASTTSTSATSESTEVQDSVSAASTSTSTAASSVTSASSSQASETSSSSTTSAASQAPTAILQKVATSSASVTSAAQSSTTTPQATSSATTPASAASQSSSTASQATSTASQSSATSTASQSSSSVASQASTSTASQSSSSVASQASTSTASQSSSSAAQSSSTSATTSSSSQASSTATNTNNSSSTTTSNSDLATGSVTGLALKLANANIPYVWGGGSLSGMDCSGLVSYVYLHAAGISLPHNTVSQEAYVSTHSVADAQPGDILFWGSRGATYHDAIYIGNNQYVAAPTEGQNVQVQTISPYFAPSFAGTVK